MKTNCVVTNPQDIKLKIETTLTLPEWKEIIKLFKAGSYYGPLDDFLYSIKISIENIEKREEIEKLASL